ncbi:MAG: YqzL family protein [Bacillota bacterium]
MFWSVFEMTGSVLAYLLYRHYSDPECTVSDLEVQ